MSQIPSNFRDSSFTVTDDNGNSATLQLGKGDIAVSNLKPGGAEAVVMQSKGKVVGHRKGARAIPAFTMTAILASPSDDFKKLINGLTAGFVSTTADIGDYPAVDFDWDMAHGAEARSITGEDLYCTGFDVGQGDEATVTFNFEVLGRLDLDGETLIPSR